MSTDHHPRSERPAERPVEPFPERRERREPAPMARAGERPRCCGTSLVYRCLDFACPFRAPCEAAVSPWRP